MQYKVPPGRFPARDDQNRQSSSKGNRALLEPALAVEAVPPQRLET
jgi:hypothetical protein